MIDLQVYEEKFLKDYKADTEDLKRAEVIRVKENRKKCPHCHSYNTLMTDHDRAETYCTSCGLITSAAITYVGLRKILYKHGRKI